MATSIKQILLEKKEAPEIMVLSIRMLRDTMYHGQQYVQDAIATHILPIMLDIASLNIHWQDQQSCI